jgi:hypothetical protein
MSYYDYSSIKEVFEMQIPNMEGSLASGLEWKASS